MMDTEGKPIHPMRKTNLQSLLAIAASVILLSSCSQVRQVTTSSNHKLHLIKADLKISAPAKAIAPKVTEKKELNSLSPKSHEISALQEAKNSGLKLRPVKSPMLPAFISKESKTNKKTEPGNKTLERVDKAFDRFDKINRTWSSDENEKRLLLYRHNNADKFLWLWISALVLDIIFWILFAVTLAFFFGVLSFLCGVAALIFFIIWLIELYSW
jgi:hypothetical protein